MKNDLLSGRWPMSESGQFNLSRRVLLLAALGLAIAALAGWWIYVHYIKSDEAKIRDAIQTAAQAARDRAPKGVTTILSKDFKGPLGSSRDDVHAVMFQILMTEFRHVQVAIKPDPIPVVVDQQDRNTARVTFQAFVRGRTSEDSDWTEINRRASGTTFHATFTREDGEWKMTALEITE